VTTVLKPIEHTRMPNTTITIPSLRDIGASEETTFGDTLSYIRIVSRETHYGLVNKAIIVSLLLSSPFLRTANWWTSSGRTEITVPACIETTVPQSHRFGTKVLRKVLGPVLRSSTVRRQKLSQRAPLAIPRALDTFGCSFVRWKIASRRRSSVVERGSHNP
jgi:hypothetical protein